MEAERLAKEAKGSRWVWGRRKKEWSTSWESKMRSERESEASDWAEATEG